MKSVFVDLGLLREKLKPLKEAYQRLGYVVNFSINSMEYVKIDLFRKGQKTATWIHVSDVFDKEFQHLHYARKIALLGTECYQRVGK